jgi:hypothetical protein
MQVGRTYSNFARGAAVLALVCAAGGGMRAQGPPSAAAFRSASGAVTIGFAELSPPAGDGFNGFAVPPFIQMPESGHELILWMLRSSPTFRRQCARLAQGAVTISISFTFDPNVTHSYAQTTISRQGKLRAQVRLRGANPRAAEHLAHEFEHILESLDDVDLRLAVAERVHGARTVTDALAFETSRAIAVGRIVADEVSRGGR